MSYINIKGERFGKLVALEFMPKTEKRRSCWLCLCDCGKECYRNVTELRIGRTKSCGCLRKKVTSEKFRKHGQTGTRLYQTWINMKGRCYNEKNHSYEDYGGRGITVCEKWRYDFQTFEDWALKNGYEESLTIDRVDVNGNYEPENCRWANYEQQARNTRTAVMITVNKSTRHLLEWCEITGADYDTVYGRIRHGWEEVEALITPKGERRK